mgnify:CR=1 FL=1
MYFVTTALLILLALHFRRYLGSLLVALGIALNFVPMASHGGLMPVEYETVRGSGLLPDVSEADIGRQVPNSKDVVLRAEEISFAWEVTRANIIEIIDEEAGPIQRRSELSGTVGLSLSGHTRRFNPSHQWIRKRIAAGELKVQQMDVQTYFFRRTNMNALGQPRSWTDHLLWHHAAHTVDLFAYQCGSPIVKANAIQGPIHPVLGIAMDMSIQLKAANGAICTLSLSFNNDGPLGTFFRYIGDTATYIARYDDLVNGKDEKIDVSKVDVSMNGIELQDREFVAAIRERREPNASVAQVLPCYEVLHQLEQQLG